MGKWITIAIAIISGGTVVAQNVPDSTKIVNLTEITLVGRGSSNDYQQMPDIVGTNIYAGKKNALVILDNVKGSVVNNSMRQVLAKVAGIHIWESDPSGIQIGIAARGLSPNRSWEFNTRQNGYDIAADPFGYPEAYYNPQLQAVQRIEVVRGQGSLQYGPQFGGMINYILRNGSEIKKPFEFETQQTAGSNNLISSFNAIGGNKNKIHYYAFFDHRNGDGWRANSQYRTNSGFATVTYKITPKLSLTAEIMQSQLYSQQAGGLTDEQIKADAQQSYRSRNWFNIKWTTPAISFNYAISENARWNTKIYGTIGDRNSVGFLNSILVKDSINPATGQYNNRVLNIDQYRNYGLESRILTNYKLASTSNSISGGIRFYTGQTWRRADGKGTTGSEYSMELIGEYGRDVKFNSKNAAVFVENIFRLTDKLSVVPGIRYEWLEGTANGRNAFDNSGTPVMLQNITRSRSFLLGGVGAEYQLSSSTELYASFAQAYRPIQFANLQAPPTTDIVDPDLKDSKGYNLDLGYRGKVKSYLQFDVSGFILQYNNRVGTITPAGTTTRLITNVGASTSKGIEALVIFNVLKAINKNSLASLEVFGSYSYLHARYSGDHKIAATKGKEVENAPSNIFRGGVNASFSAVQLGIQVSYVGNTFSDANNTAVTSANAQTGIIPGYTLVDLTAGYLISKTLQLKGGLNNLFDTRYFTRRAGGYPGPGALPGDGRTFFISVGAKF